MINHINLIMQPYTTSYEGKDAGTGKPFQMQFNVASLMLNLLHENIIPYKAVTMSMNTRRFLVKDQQHLMDKQFFMEEFNSSHKMNIRSNSLNRRWASEKWVYKIITKFANESEMTHGLSNIYTVDNDPNFLGVGQVLNIIRFQLFFYWVIYVAIGTEWWVGECLIPNFNI